jgi:hypothetical protein
VWRDQGRWHRAEEAQQGRWPGRGNLFAKMSSGVLTAPEAASKTTSIDGAPLNTAPPPRTSSELRVHLPGHKPERVNLLPAEVCIAQMLLFDK